MARRKPDVGHNGGPAADQLRSFIERIERLEEEKRGIAEDIRDVYAEAKSQGFDAKTMRRLVADRRRTEREVAEEEALLDIYRKALGMFADTPLGEAAIRRLAQKPPPPPEDAATDTPLSLPEPTTAPPAEPGWEAHTVEDARAAGRAAATAGRPVTDNPYPARDPRRAAWDEEWCKATGSDGMEIPAAWRRSPKPKPGGADSPPGAASDPPPPEEGDDA